MYYLFYVALLLFSHASSDTVHQGVVNQAVELNSCQTPRKTTGLCVPYQQCPSITVMMKIVPDSRGLAFLEQSKCGKSGENKVCCEKSTISHSQSTTTTKHQPQGPDYSVCGQSLAFVPKLPAADKNATRGFWPSMVALGYRAGSNLNRLWRCGGSLVSARWVVTAGHCVDSLGNLNLTTARMGELHLDENIEDGATPVDIEIEKIVLHPKFVHSPLQNDIALLRLSRPVTFTSSIIPVCIPSLDSYKIDEFYDFYTRRILHIVGWGHNGLFSTGERSGSKMLRETEADIVDTEKCAQMYKQASLNPIDNRSLCARELRTACHDNSGWPLIVPLKITKRESYYLAGIMSFGAGCTLPGFPAVFTNIAYFSDWIRNVTGI